VLEDRTVLSTLTVLNDRDSGPGSLRQAVQTANMTTDQDTIVFAKTIHKSTLTSGELAITHDLEIVGPGANKLTISGNDTSRVFSIPSGTTASITGLTITDGLADGDAPGVPSAGGGILNRGSLTLNNDVLANNQAVGDPGVVVPVNIIFNIAGGAVGGSLANFGTLIVAGSTFSDNQALGADNTDTSSLPGSAFPGNALGGSISNFGMASVTDSQFADNLAQAGSGGIGALAAIGGGGAILNDAALNVTGSTFVNNQAIGGSNSISPNHNGHALGGAIMSGTLLALAGAGSATLMVSQSTFSQNQALGGNNNQVTDAHVPQSDAPDNAYGGAILVYQGNATIQMSTLTHNQAVGGTGGGAGHLGSLGVGGGIFFYDFVGGVTASVEDSTITHNDAIGGDGSDGVPGGDGLGGGIATGSLDSPYRGMVPGSVTISNTTVDHNLAQGGAGGKGADGGDGLGGGLFSDTSSTLTLVSSTITHNHAKGGHGRAGGKPGQGLGDDIFP
jgi:hypothetical protein